jgi:hypothetical protein
MPIVEQRQAGAPPRDDRPDLSDYYRARFLLPDWPVKRQKASDLQEGRCAGCGRDVVPLRGHHLTYRRFYKEWWCDLIGVCATCHPYADQFRKDRQKLGRANVLAVSDWGRRVGLWEGRRHPDVAEWAVLRREWMLSHLPEYVKQEEERELEVSQGRPAS